MDDAVRFYDMVRVDDPDCIEAKFFFHYCKLMDGKKGEIFNLYTTFATIPVPVVGEIYRSSMSDEEKAELLKDIVDVLVDVPLMVNRVLNDLNKVSNNAYSSQTSQACRSGIQLLYGFGDEVERFFAKDNKIMTSVAVQAWKEGVARQQQWYGVGIDKSFPEKYAAKIQKFDTSFQIPKKAGCISIN